MLRPFQSLWEDVKGNALWDLIKGVVMYVVPIAASGGIGLDQWVKEAPAWEIAAHVAVTLLVFVLVAIILSWVMWALRSPSLEVVGEDCPILPENHEGGVHAFRLGIRNSSHRNLEIKSVEILEMDMTATRDKISVGIPFPIELSPLANSAQTLVPGEILPLEVLERPRLCEVFGRVRMKGRFPQRIPFHFSLNQDYRLRIRILISNASEYRERFVLRVSGDEKGAEILLRRIPRWKTAL